MHFGGDGARVAAGGGIARPETGGRKFFGEIFEDRERLPNAYIAVEEYRHLASAGHFHNPLFEISRFQGHDRFRKRDTRTRDLHGDPGRNDQEE